MNFEKALPIILRQHGLRYDLKNKQIECLQHNVTGKEVLALLPTGYGKTIIYSVLPSLSDVVCPQSREHKIIVISPLISLMNRQV